MKPQNVVSDLLKLYGISAVIAFAAFLIALMKGQQAWNPTPQGGAADVAAIAFVISVTVLSIGGVTINNFVFLGEKKNWQDFWATDMLEYFHGATFTERWRIARGRFMLYFLTLFSVYVLVHGYGYLRNLG